MDDVCCRVEGCAGRITLDRPANLNALTLEMIQAIHAALDDWARNPKVTLVIIDGAGRGLSAGGDLRAMHAAITAGDLRAIDTLFAAEYRLNARIASYTKPYVALMDGIVMGGGIGISAHGSHRLVTERSVLAMPEAGIGLMPDVGTTWLLGRLPDRLGYHLALTGDRFGASDAILLDLADACVPAASLPGLIDALTHGSPLADVIRAAKVRPALGTLDDARSWISAAYRSPTVETILVALRARPEPEAHAAAALIERRSPTMLKVTRRALSLGATGTLEQALEREFTIVRHCFRGREFVEGVRAAVIDKDRTPCWHPATLQAVPTNLVDSFFDPGLWSPLGLGA